MDKLNQYLTSASIAPAAFARKIGTSRGHLHDLLTGRRAPGIDLAKRISIETNGAVALSAWPNIAAVINAAKADAA